MDLDDPVRGSRTFAALACDACRRQKRKCDKQLPSCSLCQRLGRDCDYSEESRWQPSGEEFATLRQEVAELKALLSTRPATVLTQANITSGDGDALANSGNQVSVRIDQMRLDSATSLLNYLTPNSTPIAYSSSESMGAALFFLDSTVFQYSQLQIQSPYVQVPSGPLTALGSSVELRTMIEGFFLHVHVYFPIISKIRLYQHLSNPRHEPGADMALLFLAMKLCSSDLSTTSSPHTQLYHDVKALLSFVEMRNAYSVQMIQALLLVCVYEIGHSIYPAAYMSVGYAARMGYAMGLHDPDAPQMIPRTTTWTEQEERRRVWWGVLLLDRYVHVGHKGKPFATVDPSLGAHLPIDDIAWDRGKMLVAAPIALCASQTIDVAPFTRTCQAAHFMGKVVRHINDKNVPSEYRFEEALQLDRVGRSLAKVIPIPSEMAESEAPDDDLSYCNSEALCYSALLSLYDAYSCSQTKFDSAPEARLQVQKASIDGLSDFSAAALRLARRVRAYVDRNGTQSVSPLILDCLYQGAANFAWYVRESSDRDCEASLLEIQGLLKILAQRWKVAGDYLRIVDASSNLFDTLSS